jgi:phosphatidylserine/phosphatidylglycerophosphate/cardiolipin synthase-like enzyme
MKKFLLVLVLFIPAIGYADKFEKHADYTVCFTPGQNCTQQIVDSINNAVSTVRMQAYSFTSRPIGDALVTAQERGVDVKVIFDKSILNYPRNTAWYFTRHGIPVWIDNQLAIAHNKVIVIDQTRVITGSFNFTRAAENNNAENLLVIDDGSLAEKYLQNWQRRQAASQPLLLSSTAPVQENWFAQFWHWLINWLKSLF